VTALWLSLLAMSVGCHVEPAGKDDGADAGDLGGPGGHLPAGSGGGAPATGGSTVGSGGDRGGTGGAPAGSGGGGPASVGSGGTSVGNEGGAGSGTGGNASGGSASGGNASGGSASGGNASGGSASGGSASGGSASGGSASGGNSGGGVIGSGGKVGPGAGSGGVAGTGGGAMGSGANAVVAVGYGGLRIVSHDLGVSWTQESHWAENGGDDNNLLRAIAYGNGIWVSGGWRYVTSTDGVKWTDRGMAVDVIAAAPCGIIESIAFGAGRFVGACGDHLVWSTDGLSWKSLGATPDIQKHPVLMYDGGTNRFAVTGDNSKSFVSSDLGVSWTELTGVTGVRLCKGALNSSATCPGFYTDNVFLRGQWPAQIQRSADGTTWSKSVTLPASDSVYSFAVGPVAP
jgi:hypothetical protein